MFKKRLFLGLIVFILFAAGSGYIVYAGRPVMNLDKNITYKTASISHLDTREKTYSIADVEAHNSETNCWANINGSVYDLTTWVSRHPGGTRAIVNLCGTDASQSFEQRHGVSTTAQAALSLLKIGSLE